MERFAAIVPNQTGCVRFSSLSLRGSNSAWDGLGTAVIGVKSVFVCMCRFASPCFS